LYLECDNILIAIMLDMQAWLAQGFGRTTPEGSEKTINNKCSVFYKIGGKHLMSLRQGECLTKEL
jgi:hypothetical protein